MLEIITVPTPELGNRSYLVHDGHRGLVVDPPRDIDRIESAAENAQVEITAVAETHIHNDYISGGAALARRQGADYLVAAEEAVDFPRSGVRDGDKLTLGGLQIEVIHTPGHTFEHLAFLASSDDGGPSALFSGGSLLFDTVGRPDLAGAEHAEHLGHQQLRSAHRLARELPVATTLHPTHGFGSFCSSATVEPLDSSTLGEQMLRNPALLATDPDTFVSDLLAALSPYPTYYAHMGRANRAGTPTEPPAPRRLEPDEIAGLASHGTWVVDLRDRAAFAARHLPGSVNVEYGQTAATYIGWLAPWKQPIVLVGDSDEQLQQARRDLYRIGIDHVAGVLRTPEPTRLTAGYRRARWEDLVRAQESEPRPRVLVDVRQREEFDTGHLAQAIPLPLQEVESRLDEIPEGEIWVHCQSGFRAAVAASLLHRAGRAVVHIDDEWSRAASVGLPVS